MFGLVSDKFISDGTKQPQQQPQDSSIWTSISRSTDWQHSFYTQGRSRTNEAQVSNKERQVMDIRTIRKVAAAQHSLN